MGTFGDGQPIRSRRSYRRNDGAGAEAIHSSANEKIPQPEGPK
jgi:hypothetical protein